MVTQAVECKDKKWSKLNLLYGLCGKLPMTIPKSKGQIVFDAIFFGDWTKKGTEDIYLVEYNIEEKSIIVELNTIGE